MTPSTQPRLRLEQRVWRRLLQLDLPVPIRSDDEIAAEVEQNYRWNLSFNLLDVFFFSLGMTFISTSTILPLFVSKLTDSTLAIGMVAVLAQAGWYLPQLLTAELTEKLPRKKAMVVNVGFFTERVPMWLLPVAAVLAPVAPVASLGVFFWSQLWHHLGAGMIAPAWQDFIARCFPVERRGRFLGVGMFLGTGAGAAGAFLTAWMLDTLPYPSNFAYIFAIGALAITLSWASLSLAREPVQAVPPPPPTRVSLRRKLSEILRSDHNFRRYLIARLTLALGTMGIGFVTVAAIARWAIPDSTVGIYTAILSVGQTLGSLVVGWLADRYGHKLAMELAAASLMLACLIAWLAPFAWLYYLVFLLIGVTLGIGLVSGILIVLEFPEPDRRPTYIGIANTGVGIVGGLAPLLGGLIAQLSYNTLFALATMVSLLAFGLMHWTVQEPRFAKPPVPVKE